MSTEIGVRMSELLATQVDRKDVVRPAIVLNRSMDGLPFVDHSYKGARFVSKGAQGVGDIDFTHIVSLINSDKKLLYTTVDDVKGNWDKGHAIAIVEGGKAMGYATLKILPPKDKAEIDIEDSDKKIKEVIEIGAVMLDPTLRSEGLSSTLLESAMTLKIKEVKDDEAVFISITEASNYPPALQSAASRLGIRFNPAIHTDFAEISKRACDGCTLPGAINMKDGAVCPNRVTAQGIKELLADKKFPDVPQNCVMFISRADIDRPLRQAVPLNGILFNSKPQANGANGANHATI